MAKMYQGQPLLQYWEATQKVLQGDIPIVRRPRLTEALLKKPPFRFLHDIITEVCRQTGFAGGLFTQEEQISSNMKDKESKVAYLWKIVNCVGITLNAHVPARPLKIVSGMEPEQTNIFLQMLAAATIVDSPVRQRAVSRVLFGEKMPTPEQGTMEWAHRYFLLSGCVLPGMNDGGAATNRNAEETMAASLLGITSQHPAPSNEYLDPKTTGKEEMDKNNLQKLHHVGNPASLPPTQQSLPSTRGNSRGLVTPASVCGRPEEKFVKEGAIEPLMTLTSTDEAWPPLLQAPSDANLRDCGAPHQHMLDMPPSTARTETLPAAARPMTVGGDGRGNFNAWTARLDTLGAFPPFGARPQSARKGPPKIHNSIVTAEKAQPKSSAAAPPAIASSLMGGGGSGKETCSRRRPSILLDSEVQDDEESDALPVLLPAQQHLPEAERRADDDSVEEQDMLLGAIEATKEDAQTRQEEVQKLRVMVQSLCQATNPLGKSIDYLQVGRRMRKP
ncbi:hypothetical protein M758_10G091500 [Ceratodon purpureus]|uniref:TRAF3-interacting protein 1 N-terminal domain-containing protein n=1 Tax=Ceratodon purpureus TaxID=3225 RepID=A0A8T0GM59_CERPU|nr:hypothetical protein KC19_10G093100 [Ceratodon purpureus]KAG0603406.1 hypothetical protein M758_10G091500 [Ceratodon purpureus]